MIQVRSASRLHFGLIHLGDDTPWSNHLGDALVPARQFGGVGLMIDCPGIQLTAENAASWSATGPLAERALAFANRLESGLGERLPPQSIDVRSAPAEHVGLGVGTQLGLTVATAILANSALRRPSIPELAAMLGRGRRSAIGVHGFETGGLLVDGGRRRDNGIAPLIFQAPFPSTWRVVVVSPEPSGNMTGIEEERALRWVRNSPESLTQCEAMCRLAILGLIPALREGDCLAFGEALFDFNGRSGSLYAAAQGGRYCSPACQDWVSWMRGLGIRGVGQSSWGPTLFAIVEDMEQGAWLANECQLRLGAGDGSVLVAEASRGAVISPKSAENGTPT